MNLDLNILSMLIWCPVVGAIIVALLPRQVAREGAFAVALCNFAFALHLPTHWGDGMQFQTRSTSLPGLPTSYHLGVDGISMPMVLLATFLTPLVLLLAWNGTRERTKEFFVLLLLIEGAFIGAFCAQDLILFYVFFEATLIPTYILIAGWGGAKRGHAALKFFLYTMFGSILMLVAMIYVVQHGPGAPGITTFSLDDIGGVKDSGMRAAANALDGPGAATLFGLRAGTVLFCAFALAFAVKSPLFPFHTWLPDAYAEAPTAATVMLAALLSKMGVYGFMRFALPMFPNTARELAPLLMALAIAGIIYGALVAIAQTDIKRVLAYSSVSHVGVILLGVFTTALSARYGPTALSGATLQMVNHGLTTGALFLLAGLLFERRMTTVNSGTNESEAREVRDFGGLAGVMPRFAVFFWVALFASIGLPGLCNFVGEYLILQGTMEAGFVYAALAATSVILGAIYMLKMFREAFFGDARELNAGLRDIKFLGRESVALALLLALVVWIGVAPQRFLDFINPDAATTAGYVRPENSAVAELPGKDR